MIKLLLILGALALPATAQAQTSFCGVQINGYCGAGGLSNSGMVDQKDVTLDASGNATWDYTGDGFPGIPAVTHLPKAVDTNNPLICNFTARTATSVSIHCWRTTLTGILTGLLGGTVSGATVSLVARYIPPQS